MHAFLLLSSISVISDVISSTISVTPEFKIFNHRDCGYAFWYIYPLLLQDNMEPGTPRIVLILISQVLSFEDREFMHFIAYCPGCSLCIILGKKIKRYVAKILMLYYIQPVVIKHVVLKIAS